MASIPLTSDVAVVALLGFSIWEVHKAYCVSAPNMHDLRNTNPGSDDYYTKKQNLIDADVTVGMVAFGAGLAAAYMTKRVEPFLLVAFTLGAVAWYHHSILNSPQV